jgi:hypothetical protein
MKKLLIILLIFASNLNAQITRTVSPALKQPNNFIYTLPAGVKSTSAGVFDAITGELKRTLWSNETTNTGKGAHTGYFDGKDDDGNAMPLGTYNVKVLSGAVNYTWDGVIGNTSDNLTGHGVYTYYNNIADMVEIGQYMYYVTGSPAERKSPQGKFLKTAPNTKIDFFPQPQSIGQGSTFICTDGTLIYYGGSDYHNVGNYIYAINVSNDATEHVFSSGISYTARLSRKYNSVIDLNTERITGVITGMKVQKRGNYLYVAHKGQNLINVYNKTTGAFVRSINITAPASLCFESDAFIWVGQGTTVSKFPVNSDGTLGTSIVTISGFDRVSALSLYSGTLFAEDAGLQQIVKKYNSTTGAYISTIGQPGGYSASPAVANDKFYFEDSRIPYTNYIAHQSDGSIWIGDPGNCRNQHFSSSGAYINNIMYQRATYSAGPCTNDINHVFAEFREFLVDYSRPAKTSWTLINNWGYNFPATYRGYATAVITPYIQIIKFSNGRRYLTFRNTGGNAYMAELATTGLRLIPAILPPFSYFGANGDCYNFSPVGTEFIYYKYSLNGFEGPNNVILGAPTKVLSFNIGALYPKPTTYSFTVTSSNKLIVYDNYPIPQTQIRTGGYHLAAYDLNTMQWAWKTSKPTFLTYMGPYPTDERFDVGNLVKFPGANIAVLNNDIIQAYRGENFKNSEACVFSHFNDQGLMVGQFGLARSDADLLYGPDAAPAGMANNIQYGITVTQAGSDYYGWVGDEGAHGGVHRWHISNLSSIAIQTIPVTLVNNTFTAPESTSVDLLAATPESSTIILGVNGWSGYPAADGTIGGNSISSITRVNTYDMSKNADVSFKAQGSSPGGFITYKRTITFPPLTNYKKWQLSGKLYLLNAFNSIAGNANAPTGRKFHVDLLDINGKVLGTFLCITGGKITFNDVVIGTQSATVGNRPIEISVSNHLNQIHLVATGYGLNYSHDFNSYDETANVHMPGALGAVWRFDGVRRSATFGFSDLIIDRKQ